MPHAKSGIGLKETQVNPRSRSDRTAPPCAWTCKASAACALILCRSLRSRPRGSSRVKAKICPESRPVLTSFPRRPSRLERTTLCYRPTQEDAMTLSRREFLHLTAGAAALPVATSRLAWAQETLRHVRAATGLLATWQSTAWLGAEAGV